MSRKPCHQSGATLIIALIILAIISQIAVFGMQDSQLMEHLAANNQATQYSLQIAESAVDLALKEQSLIDEALLGVYLDDPPPPTTHTLTFSADPGRNADVTLSAHPQNLYGSTLNIGQTPVRLVRLEVDVESTAVVSQTQNHLVHGYIRYQAAY